MVQNLKVGQVWRRGRVVARILTLDAGVAWVERIDLRIYRFHPWRVESFVGCELVPESRLKRAEDFGPESS